MPKIHIRASARADLVDYYVYLAQEAGLEVADRFLTVAEDSFAKLMLHPALGVPLQLRNPELIGMRKWRIAGFESALIFYLIRNDGVSIVRVLHAARDWW